MKNFQWASGCGRLVLNLTDEDVSLGYHSGDCEADVRALMQQPRLRDQLAALDPARVLEYLQECGFSLDAHEVESVEDNQMRLLWTACADCFDAPESYQI